MFGFDLSWSWVSLVLLGGFHGLNPAMGWLFAVAHGIQERRDRAVINALGNIAVGHALAIAVVVMVVAALGMVVPQDVMMVAAGASMVGFAAYKVATRFRHPTRFGMRIRGRELVAWSFAMATAHGAGLMLVPAVIQLRGDEVQSAAAHSGHQHHIEGTTESGASLLATSLAVGVHTAAMFAVAGMLAMIVYRKVGVDILRRAWINMDLLWVGVLSLTGLFTLAYGIMSKLS